MRLFLDASMSPSVGAALERLGLDVVNQRAVLATNSIDTAVLEDALRDQRIMVARDYDMAELVLRGFGAALGVVIVAFDAASADAEAERIAQILAAEGQRVFGAITVIEAGRVRRRPFDVQSP